MRSQIYLLDKDILEQNIFEEEALKKIQEIGFFSIEEKVLLFMDAVESNYLKVVSKFSEVFETKETILNSVFVTGSKNGKETLEFLLKLAKKHDFDVDYTYSADNESVITCMLRDERFAYLDKTALKNWLEKLNETNPNYVLSWFELEALNDVIDQYEDFETFKLLFQMLPDDAQKSYFFRVAVHTSDIFKNCNVFELDEVFKPYIIARNIRKEDIEALRNIRIADSNILRAMMFVPSENNYLHSYEYFRDELEIFTWEVEKKFKLAIFNWYDCIL